MDYGAVAAIVLLVMIAAFTVWLLWNAFRSDHWAWGWRVLAGSTGLVGCLFLGIVFLLMKHGYEDAHAMRNFDCRQNLLSIGRALQLYATDNGDRAPLTDWTDSLSSYLGVNDSFTCPESDSPFAFAMSQDFVGAVFPDSARREAIVVFEGSGGKNSVGDANVDAVYRHDDRGHFLLGDGVIKRRTKKSI